MAFQSPVLLWMLACIPLLIGIYFWSQRRQKRLSIRYSSLALVYPALYKKSNVRQYIPPVMFLLALPCLVIAMARPMTVVTVPNNLNTIILAFDVSGSMSSNDIPPNRLAAAQLAALLFLRGLKSNTAIGIVAFSSNANVVLLPTTKRKDIETAIESLTIGNNTAIGNGIDESVQMVEKIEQQNSPLIPVTGARGGPNQAPSSKKTVIPEIIVLLTDGTNNSGPQPMVAAQKAAELGVRIYTIGYGPASLPAPSMQNPFRNPKDANQDSSLDGGKFFGSTPDYDEPTLRSIASLTNGKFYTATNFAELEKVFKSLTAQAIYQKENYEISFVFTALGAVLAALSIALSLLWHPLP